MWRSLTAALVLAFVVAGCGDDGRSLAPAGPTTTSTALPAPPVIEGAVRTMAVSSIDVPAGGTVPARLTCDGTGKAPALTVIGAPPAAAEVAVAVVDLDADDAVHWLVTGLPASVAVLDPAGLPPGAVEGVASSGAPGWDPPCPPAGDGPHRYEVRAYALAEPFDLPGDGDGRAVVEALEQAAIERATLTATYER